MKKLYITLMVLNNITLMVLNIYLALVFIALGNVFYTVFSGLLIGLNYYNYTKCKENNK